MKRRGFVQDDGVREGVTSADGGDAGVLEESEGVEQRTCSFDQIIGPIMSRQTGILCQHPSLPRQRCTFFTCFTFHCCKTRNFTARRRKTKRSGLLSPSTSTVMKHHRRSHGPRLMVTSADTSGSHCFIHVPTPVDTIATR